MKIKVCGLTQTQNISELSNFNIDFIGFNFYKNSKRYVHEFPDVSFLEKSVQKVGVFVNETPKKIVEIMTKYDLDMAQLHGGEDLSYCRSLKRFFQQSYSNKPKKIIKVLMIETSFDFDECTEFEDVCDYFLFDTKCDDYGGSGKKFNWQLLESYKGKIPYLLAGGINPKDVPEIQQLKNNPKITKCIGVDINSGFEFEPGIKKIDLIKKFKEKLL